MTDKQPIIILNDVKVSNEIVERRDVIDRTYKPLFSEIFSLRQDIFQNDFRNLPGRSTDEHQPSCKNAYCLAKSTRPL